MTTNSRDITRAILISLVFVFITDSVFAGSEGGRSGATVDAALTFNICDAGGGTWRYSGEVAVWNESAIDTIGLAVAIDIQKKPSGGGFYESVYGELSSVDEIAAGTTEETAATFPFRIFGVPLSGEIRSVASVWILNHSGSFGLPKGVEPKVTWLDEVGPCEVACGCTYSQDYWGQLDVIWPAGYDRDDPFFLSGQAWQFYLDNPSDNSYDILAGEYIAFVLNQANGSCVPTGIETTIGQATAWLLANGPDVCPSSSSCDAQRNWARSLAAYNLGIYPGGPGNCGEF
jgi:hypothetical protein